MDATNDAQGLEEHADFALAWLRDRDRATTHYEGCERDHAACAAALVIHELARLRADNARLRGLVDEAFREGWIDGTWDGGEKPGGWTATDRWEQSEARRALDTAARTHRPRRRPMNSAELRERLRRDARDLARWKKVTPPPYTVGTESLIRDLNAAAAALERMEALERQNAALRHREDLAWGLIANANGGDWTGASPEWQEAARRWQRGYEISTPAPAGQQGGSDD